MIGRQIMFEELKKNILIYLSIVLFLSAPLTEDNSYRVAFITLGLFCFIKWLYTNVWRRVD